MADHPTPTTPINAKWVPYRHPQPKESPPELVVPNAVPTDERIWVRRANAGISRVEHPGDYATQIPTTSATAPRWSFTA